MFRWNSPYLIINCFPYLINSIINVKIFLMAICWNNSFSDSNFSIQQGRILKYCLLSIDFVFFQEQTISYCRKPSIDLCKTQSQQFWFEITAYFLLRAIVPLKFTKHSLTFRIHLRYQSDMIWISSYRPYINIRLIYENNYRSMITILSKTEFYNSSSHFLFICLFYHTCFSCCQHALCLTTI